MHDMAFISWCVCAKLLQLCPILCDPTGCCPPGSSVHGILQARILEWVAMPSSRGSSQPRDWTESLMSAALVDVSLPLVPPGRERQWQSTPVLLPGKSHGWRSLVGCSPWGRQESETTERLHFHFSLSRIGEGNGKSLQCSCLENPRGGGAWWAAVYGVAQSRTWRKQLSSSIWEDHNPVELILLMGWDREKGQVFFKMDC